MSQLCPTCGAKTHVENTYVTTSKRIRRTRICPRGHRFTTLEIPENALKAAHQLLDQTSELLNP